jgi:cell division protein ZapD
VIQQQLYYEIPLNERMRSFLRAEYLINALKHDYTQISAHDSKRTLNLVIALYRFLDQTDLKQQLLQSIEQYANGLKRLLHTPEVNLNTLNQVLDNLNSSISKLSATHTQFEKLLQENPILSQLSGRNFDGMSPSFDLPEVYLWMHLDTKTKQSFLDSVLEPLGPIIQSLDQFLSLTRQCSITQDAKATSGIYKKHTKNLNNLQLIGVSYPLDLGVYPKVSANKQCLNISFYELSLKQHTRNRTAQDIPFQLTYCNLS